jgi:RNA polymerase primary sigma factor
MFNGNDLPTQSSETKTSPAHKLQDGSADRREIGSRVGLSSLNGRTMSRGLPALQNTLEYSNRENLPATPAPEQKATPRPAPSERKVRLTSSSQEAELWSGEKGLSFDLLAVGAVPLLTMEEENELAARIKAGDESARERMIRANLRLVVKIARDYEHLGLPLADLVSEGIMGLMKAVDRFDPAKGGKLSTYGAWWIKQQIRRALANQARIIRLPVHVEGKLYHLGQAEARLGTLLGREVTDDELASELSMTPKRIRRLRQSSIRPASLDAPAGEDSDAPVGELVADETAPDPFEQLRQKVDHDLVRNLLKRLPKREEKILRLRFGMDRKTERSLEEVGKDFGLTRERIRQLQNEALKKLKEMIEAMDALPTAA